MIDDYRAVEGCDYVIHMASPFVMADPEDPEEVIGPARDGTMNVIKACAEVGGVKRVVLTSSCVAVFSGREGKSDRPNSEYK